MTAQPCPRCGSLEHQVDAPDALCITSLRARLDARTRDLRWALDLLSVTAELNVNDIEECRRIRARIDAVGREGDR